jgi:hypothetical protein
MIPLVALIIFLGVYPKPVLDRIDPTINALLAQVDSENHTQQPIPGSAANGNAPVSNANPSAIAAKPDRGDRSHSGKASSGATEVAVFVPLGTFTAPLANFDSHGLRVAEAR